MVETATIASSARQPGTGASSAVVSAEKPVPISKPDSRHYDDMIKVESDAVEKLRKEINDLSEALRKGSGMNREEFQRQTTEQRSKIAECNQRLTLLVQERDSLMEKSTHAMQRGRNLRNQVDAIQRDLGFTTAAEIDKRIEELKYEMMVNPFTLKEEKAQLLKIEKLQKAKLEIKKIQELNEAATASEGLGSSGFRDRLQELRDQINELRDARTADQEKLQELLAEWQRQQAPLHDIWEKRDQLKREMGLHQTKANQLTSEKLTKETEYRAYQARTRNARMEIERWERQYQLVENDKRLVQSEMNTVGHGVFDPKAHLAQQLLSYLQHQVALYDEATSAESPAHSGDDGAADGESSKATSVEDENKIVEGVDGQKFVVLNRKKIETFTAGGKTKMGKKNGKKKLQKETPKIVSGKLQHTLSTLSDFNHLGFDSDCPMVIGDCPKAIVRLQAIIGEQEKHNTSVEDSNKRKRANLELKLAALNEKQEKLLASKPEGAKVPKPVKEGRKRGDEDERD